MKHIRHYRLIALVAILSLLFATASPATAGDTSRAATVDANAARWLQSAADDDINTFLVILSDTGTEAQISNAALLAVSILAVGDDGLREKLARYRADLAEQTLNG